MSVTLASPMSTAKTLWDGFDFCSMSIFRLSQNSLILESYEEAFHAVFFLWDVFISYPKWPEVLAKSGYTSFLVCINFNHLFIFLACILKTKSRNLGR
jgi:hypothetical protein